MKENNCKWIYPLADDKIKKEIEDLSTSSKLSFNTCTILYNRGFRTKEDIQGFLDLDLHKLYDPSKMKDIVTCAQTVIKHLKNGRVVLYSDYDTDGWGCIIVFVKAMKKLGYNVDYYTNTRKLGYGLKVEGVKNLINKFPKTTLILTSDNGIVAFDGIEYAIKDLGLEVCVTDHHDLHESGIIPKCTAVVNPKRKDDEYPFKDLCGTAIIYKLCQVIYKELGKNPKVCDNFLDIVGLATVGDVVPLISENRIFVKQSLKMVNEEKKNVWKYMREILTDPTYDKSITSKTYGFNYVASINACSRLLGDMEIPINTFILDDNLPANEELIKEGISKMKDINELRKDLTKYQTDAIFSYIENIIDEPFFTIAEESLEEGIVGIIAGRVAEKYFTPTIVLTNSVEHPEIWKGSGRSIPGFHIKNALDQIQKKENLLIGYGGHEGACGLTVHKDNLVKLKKELNKIAKKQIKNRIKEIVVDIVKTDKEFSDIRFYDEICSLEPYGQGFQTPVIGINKFNPIKSETFGGEDKQKHLKLSGEYITYIGWNCGQEWINDGSYPNNFQVIGELGFNDFENKLQLKTMDYSNITQKKEL